MIHLNCRKLFFENPCDSSSHCKHYVYHAAHNTEKPKFNKCISKMISD